VRRIFELTKSGMTSYELAMRLNADQIRTQKGHDWFRASVSHLLEKTVYYGEITGANNIIVKVPAIVSRELWDGAHAAMARNRVARVGRPSRVAADGKGFSREYLLTGYMWCATCGARCTTWPGRKLDATYRCGNIDHKAHRRICHAPGVRKSLLEPVVWDAIWDVLTNPRLLWAMLEAYHDRAAAKPAGKKDASLLRIERAQRRVQRAEAIFRDPDQPIPYAQAKADLEAARRKLIAAETARPPDVIDLPERKDVVALAREFAQGRDLEDFSHQRGIIERVVQQIRYDGAKREAEITCAIALQSKKNCNGGVRGDCNTFESFPFVINARVA
jgi:hypothetical protein